MAGSPVQKADRTKRDKMRKKKPSKEASKKSIKWSDSLLSKDPLSVLTSGNEGGFLSLEEIDESEYGLIGEVTETAVDANSRNNKNKNISLPEKRKRDGNEEENKQNDKRKKKKNKNNKEKDEDKTDIVKTDMLGEDEVYSWRELRLHPLIIKSIQRLGFKEPTPIQKACIPAAAQQGKDVIGAAETGSGKTLAFGLPILQRLLEEREKASRFVQESDKLSEKLSKDNNTQSPLRALIITPTRELAIQVCDHLKQVAEGLDIYVVPIVGGMSSEKQERLLKRGPHIVVGTPGRLWELMSAGHQHLVELHSLSFFVLDEADRMLETGHYQELQSIIDILPKPLATGPHTPASESHTEFPNLQRKKRQTLVFSATISLSDNFRRKLKKGGGGGRDASKSVQDGLGSIETLSERAGVRSDAAVIDLTNTDIMASRLEESFIECGEEDKDAYLYYILSVHGQGRTIIFCTSIAALRHLSSILRLLKVNCWTLHAQMQQRARLKAMDRFRSNDNAVLVATDVAARGLDIPHVRTVVHYQLPHSAEVYIHRSGRTARASKDGCSIALISPNDKIKFHSLCRSLSKESLKQFPVDNAFMSEVMSRLSLARQVDKIMRKNSQETAKKNWIEKNAEALGVELEVSDSEEEREREIINKKIKIISSLIKKTQQELRNREIGDKEIISSHLEKAQQELRSKGISDKEIISSQIKKAQQQIRTGEISDKKIISSLLKKAQQELSAKGIRDEIISPQLRKAQQELNEQLAKPLQPITLSHRYLAGGGVTLELQKQLEELSKQKVPAGASEKDKKKSNFVVIGHNNLVEPLQALRTSGHEVSMNFEKKKEMQKRAEIWKKKKREDKKKDREQKRKARKKAKEQRM